MTLSEMTPSVRPRWRRLAIRTTVALALLSVLVWFFLIRHAPLGRVQVDGNDIRLLRAVEGRLIYRQYDPLPSWARRCFPASHRMSLPVFDVAIDTEESDPGDRGGWLLFSVESTTPPFFPASFYPDRIEIESGGHVYRCTMIDIQWNVFLVKAESLPRRDPELTIQLIRKKGLPATLTIKNPFYQTDFPHWTPGPLPARKTRGAFSMELTDLVVGDDGGTYAVTNGTCSDPKIGPTQVVTWIEDATGNRGPYISPFEPVWKVTADFQVLPTTDSPSNQRISLGKVSIPPPDTIVPFPERAQCEDVHPVMRVIVGPGRYELLRGQWRVVKTTTSKPGEVKGPAILGDYSAIRFVPTRNSSDFQLNIRSREGAVVSHFHSEKSSLFESRSEFSLTGYAVGDEFDIELLRSRSERFEFLVTPPEHLKQLRLSRFPHLPGRDEKRN